MSSCKLEDFTCPKKFLIMLTIKMGLPSSATLKSGTYFFFRAAGAHEEVDVKNSEPHRGASPFTFGANRCFGCNFFAKSAYYSYH